MYFGFLHAPLSVLIAEKAKHFVERLLGIVHDVGECLPQTIFKKLFSCNGRARHRSLQDSRHQFHQTPTGQVVPPISGVTAAFSAETGQFVSATPNLDPVRFGSFYLRNGNPQHAFLVLGVDACAIDSVAQTDHAAECAVRTFNPVEGLAGFF